jgi:ABC-type hemin transport system substrate-binding protein
VLDVESVLAFGPDALLVAAEPGQGGVVPPWLQQQPGLAALPCVQQRRVLVVPQALLGTTSHHAIELSAFVQRQLAAWGPR